MEQFGAAVQQIDLERISVEEMGYHRRDGEIEELKADLDGRDERDDQDC